LQEAVAVTLPENSALPDSSLTRFRETRELVISTDLQHHTASRFTKRYTAAPTPSRSLGLGNGDGSSSDSLNRQATGQEDQEDDDEDDEDSS
ncbi:hypothetical protein M9458_034847, partial [Cirrhinus mrigala]